MRRIILGLVVAVVLMNTSCSKKQFACPYDPCLLKAPHSEVEKLETYLNDNSLTAVKHCSGLYYQIENEGSGHSPTGCSEVYVTYKGTLTNGNIFEQVTSPVSYSLVQLIEGWKNGLPLIKTGGKIKLFIPPSLGYGPSDYQTIPGNSILIFDIELLEVR